MKTGVIQGLTSMNKSELKKREVYVEETCRVVAILTDLTEEAAIVSTTDAVIIKTKAGLELGGNVNALTTVFTRVGITAALVTCYKKDSI